MRDDGFVRVVDLQRALRRNSGTVVTLAMLRAIVEHNNKKRFALVQKEGEWWMRAHQGHTLPSVVSERLLERVEKPEDCGQCVHGTTRDAWAKIRTTGLSRMARNHIHLAVDTPGSGRVISGARATSTVFIYLDARKLLADGFVLYRSANGVILCEGDAEGRIPPRYFARVEHRHPSRSAKRRV